jgi:hypothetical protein
VDFQVRYSGRWDLGYFLIEESGTGGLTEAAADGDRNKDWGEDGTEGGGGDGEGEGEDLGGTPLAQDLISSMSLH